MEKCIKIANCPIYKNILNEDEVLISTYKRLYCEAGKKGIMQCKRYQVSEKLGFCPSNVLPNSSKDIEEIINMALEMKEIKNIG